MKGTFLFFFFFNLLYQLNFFWKGGLPQCSKRGPLPFAIEQLGTQHGHLSFTLTSLLACRSALLPHGLQHPYTDLVHHEAPGSTAKERAHTELRCVQAQVRVHMIACVNVFTPAFDSRLLLFYFCLYCTIMSFVDVKARNQMEFKSRGNSKRMQIKDGL